MSRERRPVTAPGGVRIPEWQRISEDLVRRLRAKEWLAGDKLPSEKELAVEYSVGIATIRRAVAKIAADRFVETRHGAGTYVLAKHLLRINATRSEEIGRRTRLSAQDSWSSDVKDNGHVPSQRFECLNTLADSEQAAYFGVAEEDPLVMRRCWRYVDDVPSSIESGWYPQWLVKELPQLGLARDIQEGTTLFMARNGYPIGWSEDHYSGRPFTPEEAAFFEAPPGVFVLVKYRISFDHRGGRVLRLMETDYRTDTYVIVTEVPGNGAVESEFGTTNEPESAL